MTPILSVPKLPATESDAEVLRLPTQVLVARCDHELHERGLFQRAARSGFYQSSWRKAGVPVDRLRGRDDLHRLPFLEESHLRAMAASGRELRRALLALPRAWVTSHGSGVGTKKWLPLTLGDLAHWFGRVARVNKVLGMGEGADTLALVINEPLPQVSNAIPYLWERADYVCGEQRIEFLIVTMSALPRVHWDRFAALKRPQWLLCSVADARRLVGELGAAAGEFLRRPSYGVFWGAPLDGPGGARAELETALGLSDAYSLYFSAECREMYVECSAHDGLHLWMDSAVHEIIPDGQPESALRSSEVLFVDRAAPGTEGEYVVTTFGEGLPLLRYRTGDRIRIVDTAPCACGITHPRVQFLGRKVQT